MSVMEARTVDMSAVLMKAYELGDSIIGSSDVAEYAYWKARMGQDPEAAALIRQFQRKKDLFEECERFGHFHPEYHRALKEAEEMQRAMEQNEIIRNFKLAEERLDELLYTVSKTIAHSVSETIKVPTNRLLDDAGGCSSCGSGGGCSGGCG